jgi:hypothetical protein
MSTKLIAFCPMLRVLVCKFNLIGRVTKLKSQIFDPDGMEDVVFVKLKELFGIYIYTHF